MKPTRQRFRFLILAVLTPTLLGTGIWVATNRLTRIEKTLAVELPALDRHTSWLLVELERLNSALHYLEPGQGREQLDQVSFDLDLAYVRVEHIISISGELSIVVTAVEEILPLFKRIETFVAMDQIDASVLKDLRTQLSVMKAEIRRYSVELNNKTLYAINAQTEELRSFQAAVLVFGSLIAAAAVVIFWLLLRQQKISEGLEIAKKRAEAATLAKSYFLASMSHELRTPLNAIIGFANMIRGEYFGSLGSKKYIEYTNHILTSSGHLLHLVNDILDLSAVETGNQGLDGESLTVGDVIRDCSPIISAVASKKDIDYSEQIVEGLPDLYANRRAVKQILLNLLSNAVKFTPNGGRVALRVSASDDHHIIVIEDTGIGVPEDKLDNLTEPFIRVETDPHMAQEGTGLGLTIVKSLVDLHQGALTIESEVGRGTRVTVALPSDMRQSNLQDGKNPDFLNTDGP